MPGPEVIDTCVAEIMTRWPAAIGVFLDLDMHCVGCPIGTFHTLAEAAKAHGIDPDRLLLEVASAISGRRDRDSRPDARHQSAATGAGP